MDPQWYDDINTRIAAVTLPANLQAVSSSTVMNWTVGSVAHSTAMRLNAGVFAAMATLPTGVTPTITLTVSSAARTALQAAPDDPGYTLALALQDGTATITGDLGLGNAVLEAFTSMPADIRSDLLTGTILAS
jgi:uncharacterized protein (AIM24 family)